jgi:hypothetical protein
VLAKRQNCQTILSIAQAAFFILDNAFLFFTLGKPQKTMHSKSLNLTALLCFPNKLYTREGFEPGSSVR